MNSPFTASLMKMALAAVLLLATAAQAQVSIGDLPPGKSVTIVTTVTVIDPPVAAIISAQDTISGSNFSNVLTDDPSVAGAADPTETPVELPDVNLAVSPASIAEDGSGILTYTFTREGATTLPLTVNFAATGTASATSDYAIASGTGTASFTPGTGLGTLVIPVGQSSATLTLSPSDDITVEADETAILTVSTGAGYDVGIVTPSVTGTIVNDDTNVSVAVGSAVGEDGAANLVYTFTRVGVTASALTVNFNVTGTATLADSDYAQTGASTYSDTAGTVTFSAASSTATVTVDPTADNLVESDETVILTLAAGTGYNVVSPTAATGTINNDDSTVTVAVSPASTAEDGVTNLVYTFTRSSGPTTSALTVNFNVSGTATLANSDYTQTGAGTYSDTAGTISIPSGSSTASITVDPTTDAIQEPNETVILTLAANGTPAVSGGYSLGSPSAATGTINDDDLPQVSVAATTPTAVEGGATGLYTFTRNQTAGALVVNFQLNAASTAAAGTDFTLSGATSFVTGTGAGSVSFADGVGSVAVTLTALTESPNPAEAAETARLDVVASPGVYLAGASPNATVTITENSFLVTTTANSGEGSLRQAVLNANSIAGTDTITFSDGTGGTVNFTDSTLDTITLTSGQLDLTSNIDIVGPGVGRLAVSGNNASRVFSSTTPSVSLTVTGMSLINGLSSGDGGAIVMEPFNSLTMTECVVSGSSTSNSGGGVAIGGTANISRCTISGNTAAGGNGFAASGGVYVVGTLNLINSTVSGNNVTSTVATNGGGVLQNGNARITNSTITNNSVAGSVGAGGISVLGVVTVANTIIAANLNNTVVPDVAGSFVSAGNNLIGNSGPPTQPVLQVLSPAAIAGNYPVGTASFGAALNSTGVSSGVVQGEDGVGTSTDCCSALTNGGVVAGSIALVDRGTCGFAVKVKNAQDAGAVAVIVVNNVPGAAPFGMGGTDPTITIPSVMISQADGNALKAQLASGVVASMKLVQPFTATGDLTGTGAAPLDPLLGPLAANGGPTQTHALLSGSPALNSGNTANAVDQSSLALATDQRGTGFIRAIGTVDIGAFELQKSVSISNLAAISEGNSGTTNFVFTITRTGDTTGDVTMNYAVSGAAVNGTDFVGGILPSGTATITNGNATTTVTIPVNGDTTVEPNEAFTVTLSAPDNGYVVSGAPATSTINNDDTDVSVAVAPASVSEDGATNLVYTFSRVGVTSGTLTANFSVGGTSAFGTDYTQSGADTFTSSSGTVTFGAGNSTATITLDPTADNLVEGDETAVLTVTGGAGYNVTGSAATGAINNDDSTVTIAVAPASVTEDGAGNLVYTLTRTTPATNALTVNVNVTGTASLTGDYGQNFATFNSGTGAATVTFGAGSTTATVTIDPTTDSTGEPDETVILTLAANGAPAATGGYEVGTPGAQTGTLLDDDTVVSVAVAPASRVEGSGLGLVYTFTRTGNTAPVLSVNFNIGGTATFATDYTQSGAATFNGSIGTVTLPAGQASATVTLTPLDESTVESNETAILTVASGVGYAPSGSPATGTIVNDDSSTAVVASVNPSVFGQTVTFTATVSGGSISPTGTVAFSFDGGPALVVALTAGQASLSTSVLSVGPRSVAVTYSGDANLGTSSGSVGVTVNKANTTTALTSSLNPSVVAEAVTFTATVTASAPGSGTPTGTVTFTVDGSPQAPVSLSGGIATFTTSSLAAGSRSIVASYNGSTSFNASVSGALNQTVNVPTVSVSAVDDSADENTAGIGIWRITRNTTAGSTAVQLQIDASSTAVAADWTQSGATFGSLAPGSTGSIVIPSGSSFVDFSLTPSADLHAEAAETVRVNVTADSAYTIGSPSNATVTIGQNDFLVINTNNAGEGTLRQAVLNANALVGDDTIAFSDGTGGTVNFTDATVDTIALSGGEITLASDLTIAGSGANVLVVQNTQAAGATSRVFNITNGLVRLRGLTITGGNATTDGGGIQIATATNVTLVGCAVSGNRTTTQGGGIYATAFNLSIVSSTISGNSAAGVSTAGGIESEGTTFTLLNSTVSGNSSTAVTGSNAGGLRGGGTVINCTITNNSVANPDPAIVGGVGGGFTISNSIIAGNVANTTRPDIGGLYTSNGGNIIGNVGTATGFTATNDLTGNGASPVNPFLGPLQNNGGPTLTHALLNGSPAINNGLAANLPADTLDLDGDLNVAEALPVDQRGGVNLRTRGTAPDAGAVEAFAFEPTITASTTNEDTQSTTGLVITANTADGGLTTHYQIGGILNGALFKNDGTTAITNGSFITKAEGAAGLKFTPAANLNSPNTPAGFGFTAQAAEGTTAPGDLRGATVQVAVTVTAVNDVPTVVAPGIPDQPMTIGTNRSVPLPPHFADVDLHVLTFTVTGNTTPARASAVINGTNVDLSALAVGSTQVTIQADDSNGGAITDTFLVTVGTVNATPTMPATPPGGFPFSYQTGLFSITVPVQNTTAFAIPGFRLHVDFGAYMAAHPSLRLFNATNAPGASPAYVDHPYPVAVGATVPVTLLFYTNNLAFPNPFAPVLNVETLKDSAMSGPAGPGVPVAYRMLPDKTFLLEWTSVAGRWYRIRYSSDMTNWFICPVPIQAGSSRQQWIDNGAPFTPISPADPSVTQRFYVVEEILIP